MNDSFPKVVAVAAPSGPLSRERALAGIRALEYLGVEVRIAPHVFAGHPELPYLSASIAERMADLHWSWHDETVEAVWCLRGGYGAAQLLPFLDWDLLRRRKLPIIGFSDITALHWAMECREAGIPVAAPMIGRMADAVHDGYVMEQLSAAFAPSPAGGRPVVPEGGCWKVLRSGTAVGRPLVGNLAVAASLCGTGFLPSARGRIVVFEDLNEAVYRVDRYLTQLEQNGFFAGCAAVLFGGFLNCGEPDALKVLFRRALGWTEGPVGAGFPFSHGERIGSFSFGQEILVELE